MAAEAGAGIRPLGDADPRAVGPYRLTGRLGSGGMGSVFAGLDQYERRVAIKIVHAQFSDDREFRARFSREVALLRRVQGTCTTPVLDADVDAPQPWFACEYVPGPTLQERIERQGPMTGDELFALAAGLAEALVALHGVGIVHRDIKPQNVVCSPAGPRVLDLGIARSMEDSGLTRTGMMIGSPAWMSPERFKGQNSTPAADVYAWAMMVTYASTGVIPFGTGAPEVVAMRVLQDDPDTAGVPQALRGIVDWSAEKDPFRRPSAHQVLETVTGTWRGALGAGAPAADPVSDATSLINLHWKAPAIEGGWASEGSPAAPPAPPSAPPAPPVPGTGRRRAGRHAAAPAPEFGQDFAQDFQQDVQQGQAQGHGFGQPGGFADGATVPAPLPVPPPGVPQPRGAAGSVPPLPPTPPPMPPMPPAPGPGAAAPAAYPPYGGGFESAPGQATGTPHISGADEGDTIVGDSLAGLFANSGGADGSSGRRRGRSADGDGHGGPGGGTGSAFARHRKPLIAAAAVVAAIVGVVAAVAALGDDKKDKPPAPPVAQPDIPPPGTLVGPGVFDLSGLKLTIPAGWDARPNGPATVCVAPLALPVEVRTDCLRGGLRVWVGASPDRKLDFDDPAGWTLGAPAAWCPALAPGATGPKPKTSGRKFQKLGPLNYEYARYTVTCGDGTSIAPQVWWLPQSKISFSTGGLPKTYEDAVAQLITTMDKKSYKIP